MPPIDPLKIDIKLDATNPVSKLIDIFVSGVQEPVRAAGALAADIIEVIRGPFVDLRLTNLEKLTDKIHHLHRQQKITIRHPLSPRACQLVLEKGSFATDERIRDLWAQLIVNCQAGMSFDDYLFDILSKLNGTDVAYLLALKEQHETSFTAKSSDPWIEKRRETPKMCSLGLVEPVKDTIVEMKKPDPYHQAYGNITPPTQEIATTRENTTGYTLSDFGILFLAAVNPQEQK